MLLLICKKKTKKTMGDQCSPYHVLDCSGLFLDLVQELFFVLYVQ